MNIKNSFKIEDIVRGTRGILLNGDMGKIVRGISTDTRIIKPGFLFWALKGKNFDGHSFWKEAIEKGAQGIVISRFPENFKVEELPQTIVVILVKDTLSALKSFASFWRKKINFHAVAVAGSCGKTTTKEMIAGLLSHFFSVEKSEKNYNNEIGLSLSILKVREDIEIGVFEIGTNSLGEVSELARILEPQTSVITHIGPEHLEGLKDLEGVLKEEISLFEHTDKKGNLVYNSDVKELAEEVERFPQKKLGVGFSEGADLKIEKIKSLGDSKKEITLRYKGEVYTFRAGLYGRHNVLNLCLAIGTLSFFVQDFKKILKVAEKEQFFTRIKVEKFGRVIVFDDSYNANPLSLREGLLMLQEEFPEVKKILILGDMKELGTESEKFHKEIGELAGKIGDVGVFIGEFAETYQEGFKTSGKPSFVFETKEEFFDKGLATIFQIINSSGNDRILIFLKASRSLAFEEIKEVLEKKLKEL